MRVLQIVGGMNMGGLETFVMNIFRNSDREKTQFDFLYITEERCFYDNEIEALGGRIFRITARHEDLHQHCKELREFILSNQDIDVVHIHAVSAFCLVDAVTVKRAGIDHIIIHSHASLAPHRYLHRMMKQWLPVYAEKMIACSDTASAWMYPVRSQKEVEVLPNGIDVYKYAYDLNTARDIREELHLTGKFVIGHIGRMTEVKNHKFLLAIFSEIKKNNPNAELVLAGDGPLHEDLVQEAKRLGITGSVHFLGVRKDVDRLLQAFDAFVFPSLREGLPVSVIEAQAAGLQCFLSDSITREAGLTSLVTYLPLDAGAEFWAREIEDRCSAEMDHADVSSDICKAGFDIKQTASILYTLYKNMSDSLTSDCKNRQDET